MKFIRRLLCFVLLAAAFPLASPVLAQDSLPDQKRTGDASGSPALPRTFRGLSLGMDLDALKPPCKKTQPSTSGVTGMCRSFPPGNKAWWKPPVFLLSGAPFSSS